jgi:hypothetical protein
MCDPSQTCVPCGCAPDQECAENPCGGSCGTCGGGLVCEEGKCVDLSCAEITYQGCCQESTLKYCSNGSLKVLTCGENQPPANVCGWDPAKGYYNCGGKGADPSGELPITCASSPDSGPEPGPEPVAELAEETVPE